MEGSTAPDGASTTPASPIVDVGDWILTTERLLDRFEDELLDAALALPNLNRDVLRAIDISVATAPQSLLLAMLAGGLVLLAFMLSFYKFAPRRDAAALDPVPLLAVLKLTGWSLLPLLIATVIGRLVSVRYLDTVPAGTGFPRDVVIAIISWLASITFLGIALRPGIAQLRLVSLDETGARRGLRHGAGILAFAQVMACLWAAAERAGMPPNSIKLLAIAGAVLLSALVFRLLHLLRRHGLTPLVHFLAGSCVVVGAALWVWGWLMQQFDLYQGIKGTVIALLLAMAFDRSIALTIELSRRPAMMRRLFVLRVVVDALGAVVILRLIVEYWLVGTFAVISDRDWPLYSRQLNFALLALFLAAVLAAVTHAWVEARMMPKEVLAFAEDEDLRRARMTTVLPIVKAGLLVLIVSAFSLVALSALGVDTTPVIAGAGILGLAVSLGSQALVKDVISGIFWMLDDAFRLGEEIEIDGTHGRVEQIQIRSLRLRDPDDRLHTIPYGQIETVASRSRGLLLARVSVLLKEPPDAVRQDRLLRLAAATLRSDASLREAIIGKITIGLNPAAADGRNLVLKFHLSRTSAANAPALIDALLVEVLEASGFGLVAGGIVVSLEESRTVPHPQPGQPQDQGQPALAPAPDPTP
ncbi:mechanosensitive ion channel domain-containing protein [Rhizobium sp. FY34]|uniref:mechanosensitive ion channel family protein n=1 Tax=Rhizobium sp. FY34 TaxID=2562309 RepID=UPI001485BFD2|nr:mechanosensitive ion channel domain-containing protein [Rhizobium sp. FY34]